MLRMQPCHVHLVLVLRRLLGVNPVLCDGRVDPHHDTHGRGMGQKTDDERAIPLCRKHHDEFHDGHGFFEHMDKAARHEWHDRAAAEYKPWDDVF